MQESDEEEALPIRRLYCVKMAGPTRLELATSCVTGRRSDERGIDSAEFPCGRCLRSYVGHTKRAELGKDKHARKRRNMLSKKKLLQLAAARMTKRRKDTYARRQRIAEEFAAQLRKDLPNASAADLALVDAAVSAHVVVSESATKYLHGRLTDAELARLSLARGQLHRMLKALGLVGGPVDVEDEPAGAALAQWAADRRSRLDAAAAAAGGPSEATSATSEGRS